MYIILGNFNICVGSRKSDDDEWSGVREPYWERAFVLSLDLYTKLQCATHGTRRTTYGYKQTWQHPKSKQWSCIDFAVMRQRDRAVCIDVTAKMVQSATPTTTSYA